MICGKLTFFPSFAVFSTTAAAMAQLPSLNHWLPPIHVLFEWESNAYVKELLNSILGKKNNIWLIKSASAYGNGCIYVFVKSSVW